MGTAAVFYASRWKALLLVVGSLLFVLAGWAMYDKRPVVAVLGMLLFDRGP